MLTMTNVELMIAVLILSGAGIYVYPNARSAWRRYKRGIQTRHRVHS
jgi:hypothetical protein